MNRPEVRVDPADEPLFDLYWDGPLIRGMLPYNYAPMSARELRARTAAGLSVPGTVYNVRLAVPR